MAFHVKGEGIEGNSTMNAWRLIKGAFAKAPSVASVVEQWFSETERDLAIAFYEPWAQDGTLEVQLGDGYNELSISAEAARESFFKRAWFHFVWRPWAIGDYIYIGIDAEDDCGSVVIERDSGQVCYLYDDLPTPLSATFGDFLRDLKAAGWKAPPGVNRGNKGEGRG